MIFGYDHELWSYLSPGDRIAVLAVAQFPAWRNHGKAARLKFWEFFDPQHKYTDDHDANDADETNKTDEK